MGERKYLRALWEEKDQGVVCREVILERRCSGHPRNFGVRACQRPPGRLLCSANTSMWTVLLGKKCSENEDGLQGCFLLLLFFLLDDGFIYLFLLCLNKQMLSHSACWAVVGLNIEQLMQTARPAWKQTLSY